MVEHWFETTELCMKKGSHRPDLEEQIRSSEFFVVLATEGFFKDALTYVQVEIAKRYNKPFRVMLQRGTQVPDNFLEGVSDVAIEEWSTDEELKAAYTKLLNFKKGDEIILVEPYVK